MTAVERLAMLPNWPIRMSEDVAAMFVGVSKSTFRKKWESGEYPQPCREDGRIFWHRDQLTQFVDKQFGLSKPPAQDLGGDKSWADFR